VDVVGRRRPRPLVDWAVIVWLVVIHVGALAAPWTFTWQALALAVVLHWLTGGIGICLGYHRLLTHGSFSTYRPVRWLFAVVGGLAGEGSAIDWVANHRQHHALSDKPGDPHSPRDGSWWSHIFWLGWSLPSDEHQSHLAKWAPDLYRDPAMRFLGRMFLPLNVAMGLVLLATGYAWGGGAMAASFVVWGMFVRLVFVLHSTWLVNSASHMWGYRNYETTDDSRNNWWVAIVTYGEGWHNNHHAYPRMALHGHKWWEVDMTYAAIRLLKLSGLAWDVVDYKQKSQANREAA
jgi:stearoyl-CoA desaturase (delta-9 desaturase)